MQCDNDAPSPTAGPLSEQISICAFVPLFLPSSLSYLKGPDTFTGDVGFYSTTPLS